MISVYIDKNLEKHASKINYALENLFSILGYSWKILTNDDCPKDNETLIYYCDKLLEKEDLDRLAKHFSLIYIKADTDFYTNGVYSGEKLKNNIRRIEILKKVFPIICQKNIEHPILISKALQYEYASIEFDLIGNIFFHLAEQEFKQQNPDDLVKKKKHKNESAFEEFHSFPYMNRLILVLDKTIQEFLRPDTILVKKSLWPKNEQIAFTLSYNVDSLHKWKIGYTFKAFFEGFYLLFSLKWNYFFKSIISWVNYMVSNIEPYWNFHDINEKEAIIKARSTWFLYKKTNNTPEIDYDLNDEDLSHTLEELVHYGSELAFLSSNRASDTNQFKEEFEAFSNKLKPVNPGIRHLQVKSHSENSMVLERDLKFLYDSSKISSREYGFANGTCFPYKVWPGVLKSNVRDIWEIPINFNEKAISLSKYNSIPFETAKSYVRELFSTAKDLKGLVHFSFNISSFTDISYLHRLYSYIIDQSRTYTAYRASLSQIILWLEKRNKVKIEIKHNKLLFTFPDDLEEFSVRFFGNYKFIMAEGGNCACKDKTIRFYNVIKNSVVTVYLEKDSNSF
ncbi:MAG: hypothetical protein KA886_09330 [Candidatus Cloacimonetes bacterium]|nr:hypothetical protein [Candidatus Cloacimonadota bacterium]